MSIEISLRNEARLKATAQGEGISVDAWVERFLNEREEFAAIVVLASAHLGSVKK
jgi:predicted HicB family RNase H-like nuclease